VALTRKIVAISGDEVREKADMLCDLCETVFGDFDPGYLHDRLPGLTDPVLHLMTGEDGDPLAFKLGYRRSQSLFYSWLGGTVSGARGQGIAGELMHAQHVWARTQGYRHIETRTRAANNAMIVRNLKSGFHIVGHEIDTEDRPVVTLRIALV